MIYYTRHKIRKLDKKQKFYMVQVKILKYSAVTIALHLFGHCAVHWTFVNYFVLLLYCLSSVELWRKSLYNSPFGTDTVARYSLFIDPKDTKV